MGTASFGGPKLNEIMARPDLHRYIRPRIAFQGLGRGIRQVRNAPEAEKERRLAVRILRRARHHRADCQVKMLAAKR